MPKVIDMKQKERFIELRAKGIPYGRIATELDVSKPTLIKWGKELEMEVNNAKALEKEVLQEEYFVSWAQRVQLVGGRLKSIRDELDKRDYTDVPTEKLMEMEMKYTVLLKQDETKVSLKVESDDPLDDTLRSFNMVEFKA
ncbi:helix-turn-helix domain-containing protein [Peribacillus asahii]|uniref:helix-turn-helix domain-containing protein n=1 Tax=Peribacillus asahii TaxID=228899 RepID=UPI00207AB85F|nr:hypothetical protein [Peribacillus asahii]USK83585.1 hypothetical protein LIT35_14090 [Peribacillus asahii]